MKKYRRKCLREKPEECEICGSTENVEVHHKDGDPQNNSIDNLIPLCSEHHKEVHRNESPSEELNEAVKSANKPDLSHKPCKFSPKMVRWAVQNREYLRAINTRSDCYRMTLPQPEASELSSDSVSEALVVPKTVEVPDEFPEADFEVYLR